jgi:hypothetical protein
MGFPHFYTHTHTDATEERIKHFTELKSKDNVLLLFHNGGCFYCDVVDIDVLTIKNESRFLWVPLFKSLFPILTLFQILSPL